MPLKKQQKIVKKVDARLYQDGLPVSTAVVSRVGLRRLVQDLLRNSPPHVWLLSGPLGAGKTTLVQVVGDLLGVRGDITSPTFSLQKIHPLFGQPWQQLVHLDAYRLREAHEIAALELPEHIADPESLLIVEWPERLPKVLWGKHLRIRIAPSRSPQTRMVQFRRS